MTTFSQERRQWTRLNLPVPLFVRAVDEDGLPFTHLAVALNISAGGALVALRRSLPPSGMVSVEVPRPPMPDISDLPVPAQHSIDAKIVRLDARGDCYLVGLQFVQPITTSAASAAV